MRKAAFNHIYTQIIVILCIVTLLYLDSKKVIAYSLLWGGGVCILPNLYFAHKLFAQTGAKAVRQILATFYISEVVKFIITIVLFWIAFKYFTINKIAIFIGYLVAQFTFWFSAVFSHQTVKKI